MAKRVTKISFDVMANGMAIGTIEATDWYAAQAELEANPEWFLKEAGFENVFDLGLEPQK